MSREKHPIILKDAYMITPHIKHLVFKRVDNLEPNYTPGQFVNIHFTVDGESLQRSYSIATLAGTSPTIEIAIAYVEGGQASNYLFHMEKGAQIEYSGPFGRLILKEDEMPKRYVLIATGTGVAPYRAMLPEIEKRLKNNPESRITVVLGVPKPDECLYREDFVQLAKQVPNFEFYACYSAVFPEAAQPYEHPGRVQAVFNQLAFKPEEDVVYLCGNPSMVDDVYKYLQPLGFNIKNVRREKYVFSH